MNRFRLGAALTLVALAATVAHAPRAIASADVHKLSLVISAIPGSVQGTGFNDMVSEYNATHLTSRGLEGVSAISFAWLFGADLHYFVRPNVAMDMGVGQLRANQKREYLPALTEDIQIRTEVLSVPLHFGADYYLTPYNQGDFQARAYFGAGVMSAILNKVLMEQVEVNADTLTSLGGTGRWQATMNAPGYYVEGGVHMFFASKFSVMLGAIYHSIVVRDMSGVNSATVGSGSRPATLLSTAPFTLNLSGLGAKMAIAIGF